MACDSGAAVLSRRVDEGGHAMRGHAMKRWLVAVIATLALVVPTLAEAACAWVLWYEHTFHVYQITEPSTTWRLVSGHSHEADCRQELERQVKQAATPTPLPPSTRQDVKVDGNVVSVQTYRGERLFSDGSVRYLCLPDTIDPRGPKGGTR
jgi:hypothetical protein